MENTITSELIWVDSPRALHAMINALQGYDMLAVDTESNSLYAYQEQVCLIQFSTLREDYLVDPLALDDLSGLAPIFATSEIEKVFHAAEYDIICLKRDFGFSFNNIFDTMLAARILKHQQIGLGAMLESEFGITLDKRFQRANWGQRPLPDDHLAYARLDTHYLIDLRQCLNQRLHERGLSQLAREDFKRLTQVHANNLEDEASHFWRLAAKADLSLKNMGVLFELYRYRENFAKNKGKPVFKVMGDQLLLEIAGKAPLTEEALEKVPGMNRRQANMHGNGILAAVKRGLVSKPPQRPSRPHPNGRYLTIHEALRNWRKETAQRLGVESDIVLPRDIMEEIARTEPRSTEQLQRILCDLPWRYNEYGADILSVMRKQE